jgi:hypothetical protein
MLERCRKAALAYGRSLPDFVCTEVIKRYTDQSTRPGQPHVVNWHLDDTLTVKLTYFEQKEDHKLNLIDGNPTDLTLDSIYGALGTGEFGGMLYGIFQPSSAATFRWERWKDVRRRRAAVYSYVVQQSNSSYLLAVGMPSDTQRAIVGYHGELVTDRETGDVLSFTYQADGIPKRLLLTSVITTVLYDFADVGGRKYLLPASSETEMRSPVKWVRNRIEFRDYNKFSSQSTITFDAVKEPR